MILLIDSYDSFSYNLYQLVGEIEPDIKVIRNDEMTVEEIRKEQFDRIILSPGPGRPENAGVIVETVKMLGTFVHPHPRRLPRPSGNLYCLWGNGHVREGADARKTVCGKT